MESIRLRVVVSRTVFVAGCLLAAVVALLATPATRWDVDAVPVAEGPGPSGAPLGLERHTDQAARYGVAPHIAGRSVAAAPGAVFVVRDRDTQRPVSGVSVWKATIAGRRGQGACVGTTGADGMLRWDDGFDAGVTFYASSRGLTVPFAHTADSVPSRPCFEAWLPALAVMRFQVVDESGAPVVGASIVVSPRQIGCRDRVDWALPPATDATVMPGVGEDREAVLATDDQGRADFAAEGGSHVSWSISKPGYAPWGNDLPPRLSVPGEHRIVLAGLVGTGLYVEGDDVVSHAFDMPFRLHQPSLVGLADVGRHLAAATGALFVFVAPAAAVERSTLRCELFLRHLGRASVELPLRPIDGAFRPHVHRVSVPDPARRQSATVQVKLRTAEGREATDHRWSLVGRSWRFARDCCGAAPQEIPPGVYAIGLGDDLLRQAVGSRELVLAAGESRVVEWEVPRDFAECAITLVDGQAPCSAIEYTVAIAREGALCASIHEGPRPRPAPAMGRVWLRPDTYEVRAWVPGFGVVTQALDVPTGTGDQVLDIRLPMGTR